MLDHVGLRGGNFRRFRPLRRFKPGRLASRVSVPHKMITVWLDFGASLGMVWELLFVPETLLALTSCLASFLIFEEYFPTVATLLDGKVAGFLLAFPLHNAITETYRRRQVALTALADFRAIVHQVFVANAVWDWPGTDTYNGRHEDNRPREEGGVGMKKKPCNVVLPLEHQERVQQLLFRILDAVQDLLLVPQTGHPRMDYSCGRREKLQVLEAESMGRAVIMKLFARLHRAVEDLKAAGLPVNEASALNVRNRMLVASFETLWSAKTYHSPVALNAIVRVFIIVLPFFYGPFWLHVARGDSGQATMASRMYALAFSSTTVLLMLAMANLGEQMENPFWQRGSNRDSLHVKYELDLARKDIVKAARDMHTPWHEDVRFEWEGVGHGTDDDDSSDEDSDEDGDDSSSPTSRDA